MADQIEVPATHTADVAPMTWKHFALANPNLFFMLVVLCTIAIIIVSAIIATAFGWLKLDVITALGIGTAIGGLIGVLGRPETQGSAQ
jgi:hypothetical protein